MAKGKQKNASLFPDLGELGSFSPDLSTIIPKLPDVVFPWEQAIEEMFARLDSLGLIPESNSSKKAG